MRKASGVVVVAIVLVGAAGGCRRCCPPSATSPRAVDAPSPVVVEIHDVADLVAALERLGPEVDLTHEGASPSAWHQAQLTHRGDEALAARAAAPPSPAPAAPAVERLRESLLRLLGEHLLRTGRTAGEGLVVEARGGSALVVRGTRSEHEDVHRVLEGWRETWRARWPEAFPAA